MSDRHTPEDEQSPQRDRKLLDDAWRQVEEARERAEETATLPQETGIDAPGAGFVVPERVGSVRLVREMGRGGMGVVHLGFACLLLDATRQRLATESPPIAAGLSDE